MMIFKGMCLMNSSNFFKVMGGRHQVGRIQASEQKKQGPGGFTIIEMLIALLVLSIGILGLAEMQIASIGGNDSALKISEATAAVQTRIDLLMSAPYALVSDGGPETDEDGYSVQWSVLNQIDMDYDGNNDLDLNQDGTSDVKHVTVTATDPLGNERLAISFIRSNL